jgi:diguanylate cyclase (GGDEF)-like protein
MHEQIKELESKLEKLAMGPETEIERIDLNYELALKVMNTDPKRALTLSLEIQERSRSAGYRRGAGNGLRVEGLCYYWHSNYSTALAKSQEALAIFEETGDRRGQANTLNTIGGACLKLGEHSQALIYHLKSLKLWHELDDPQGLAGIYNNIGVDYVVTADYGNALEYYLKSLKIKQDLGDRLGQAGSLMNVGGIYENMERYQEALEHYEKSLQLYQSYDDIRQGYVLNNIGGVYLKLGESQKALNYFSKCLAITEKAGYQQAQAAALMNIGETYKSLGHYYYPMAMDHFYRSLQIAEEIGEKYYQAEILLHLGEIFADQRSAEPALEQINRGLAIAQSIDAKELIKIGHQNLAAVYRQREQYGLALEHYQKFHQAEKAIFNEAVEKKLQSLTIQFEVRQAQTETALYRRQNQELERTLEEVRRLNRSLEAADRENGQLLEKLQGQTEVLESLISEDTMTGLLNRRTLLRKLDLELARAKRYDKPLSVIVVRVERVEAIRERFTYQAGDEVINTVAGMLKENLRLVDIVARYDRELFAMVLPETGDGEAQNVCQRMLQAVNGHGWQAISPELKVAVQFARSSDLSSENGEKMIAAASAQLAAPEAGGS